jgi:hypothetical protein
MNVASKPIRIAPTTPPAIGPALLALLLLVAAERFVGDAVGDAVVDAVASSGVVTSSVVVANSDAVANEVEKVTKIDPDEFWAVCVTSFVSSCAHV